MKEHQIIIKLPYNVVGYGLLIKLIRELLEKCNQENIIIQQIVDDA